MAAYNATMRMEREQKVKVKMCGDCGTEITDSEILCQACIVINAMDNDNLPHNSAHHF